MQQLPPIPEEPPGAPPEPSQPGQPTEPPPETPEDWRRAAEALGAAGRPDLAVRAAGHLR